MRGLGTLKWLNYALNLVRIRLPRMLVFFSSHCLLIMIKSSIFKVTHCIFERPTKVTEYVPQQGCNLNQKFPDKYPKFCELKTNVFCYDYFVYLETLTLTVLGYCLYIYGTSKATKSIRMNAPTQIPYNNAFLRAALL